MISVKQSQHGTMTGYVYGCRCESCTAANTKREKRPEIRAYHRAYWQRPDVKAKNAARMRIRKARELQAAYLKERRRSDIAFAIEWRLRSRMSDAVRRVAGKKTKTTLTFLGCTLEEFKLYLEARFSCGMSWENRRLWHVDHIRPCATYDLTDPAQQSQCFHYTNLQPLWATDNLQKGRKYVTSEPSCESTFQNTAHGASATA